jgi:hypothetical protein
MEVNIQMRILSLVLALLVPLVSEVQADIVDPELDYVNTPEVICSRLGILKTDAIVRLDIDLDGSGNQTIFLNFKGTGSRGGANWTAYSPGPSGYVRTDGIQFREDFFRAGIVPDLNPSGGLLVLYPGKGAGKLVRYPFSGGRVQEQEELRILDYSKAEDRDLFERIFDRKLNDPLPKEYFTNPPHKVIDVKDIFARVPAAQITTPPTTTEQSTPVPTPLSPAPVEKQAPKPEASSTLAVETKSAPSGFPIVPVAIVGAVIVGIVVFLLRRKSS